MPVKYPSGSGSGGVTTTVATDPIWDVKGDLAVGTGADTAVRKAVGADGTTLRANAAATGGVEWLAAADDPQSLTNLVFPLAFPLMPLTGAVLTAFRIYYMRFVIPKTGTLAGIAYYVGVSSGNYNVAVFDDGTASAGNRTKLFEIAGATAAMPVAGVKELAAPALAVTRGQHIDVLFQADNATAQIGGQAFSASALGTVFPANYATAPGGAALKLMGTAGTPGSLGISTPIAEATFADPGTQRVPQPVLRIT